MTMALCFNCGHAKFGALCPCEKCEVGSTGDINLDIAFSDHRMTLETIQSFGEVIKSIRSVCDDDELRFWVFLRYISQRHSNILTIQQTEEATAACDAVLARAQIPTVVVKESEKAEYFRKVEEQKLEEDS